MASRDIYCSRRLVFVVGVFSWLISFSFTKMHWHCKSAPDVMPGTLAVSVRLCNVIFCRLFIDPKASLACLLKALCLRVLTLILTCAHICERNFVWWCYGMGLVRASADVKVFGCCFCLAYVHSAFCLFAGIVRFIVNETDFFFFF